MTDNSAKWTTSQLNTIREQLNQIVNSELFVHAERQSRFLTYIVEEELAGRGERLNQYLIATEVFDRGASFDPLVDSIVRVEARRLRSKLVEYYADPDRYDTIIITLPKGRYQVSIEVAGGKQNTAGSLAGAGYRSAPARLSTSLENKPVISPERLAIAVLPFENLSGNSDQDYFSDGMTEDIITDLSKLSGLVVISRHSTFVYKGKSLKIKEISDNLGARYVLEGSVRSAGEQVRVSAQLIDASTDSYLWADRYDRQLDDIFLIQDDLSRKIVNALKVQLTSFERQRLGHKGTANTEAHDLLLRAQEQFYQFTPEKLSNALELLSKALELDPNYAEVYAWKSRILIYSLVMAMHCSKDKTLGSALDCAKKAVDLDNLLPLAHASLGWALMWSHQINDAIDEVNRALELDANFADGYLWQSMILSSAGKGQEALNAIESGIQINPHYTVTYIFAIANAYFTQGHYEQALVQFERGIQRNSNFFPNHLLKASTLGLLGRLAEAKDIRSKVMEFDPHYQAISYNFFNDEKLHKRFNEGLRKAGLERA